MILRDNNYNEEDKSDDRNFEKINPIKISMRIAGIYCIIGSLWIILSDDILMSLISDKHTLKLISIAKGWIYVCITSIIIFYLVCISLKRIKKKGEDVEESYKKLEEAHEELESVHEELEEAYGQLGAVEEELRQQLDELVESQINLLESEERYRLIFDAVNEGIWNWDIGSGKRYISDSWYEIMSYPKGMFSNVDEWYKLVHPEDLDILFKSIEEHIQNKTKYYACEFRFMTGDGEYKWILSRGKALFDEKGVVYRLAGSHNDITDIKNYQDQLYHLAYHELITGLPNRLFLYENLTGRINRDKDCKLGVIFINIDKFKYINDTLGYIFGDKVIIRVAERIKTLITEECSLYSLNGDEYIVTIDNIKETTDVENLCDHISRGFKEPFNIETSTVHIHVSMGMACYPKNGENIEELLKCADLAVHKAKELGGNKYVVYKKPMYDTVIERTSIEEGLRVALEKNEMVIYYQPQLDIKSNKITGFEALLRWNSAKIGSVSPLKFIKVAEDTHLIISIGAWVLKNSCSFLKKLNEKGYRDITISINISILQLLQEDFLALVMNTINLTRINPEDVELEITESILMESFEDILWKLRELKKQGVKIALDDFGKGYSSLSYLKQLPISTLKIDKAFIDDISMSQCNKTLTGQIVAMGRIMGISVVAEGVETEAQLEYLQKYKCNKIQGYIFSRPLPEKEAINLLKLKEDKIMIK